MQTLLKGFPVDIRSKVTPTELGFQITTGPERLRVKVAAGSAMGWEHGSPCWVTRRDEWVEVRAGEAVRCDD